MSQYVAPNWFVEHHDYEQLVAYAQRHDFDKPCDLLHHLLTLALDNEAVTTPRTTTPVA